MDTSSISDEYSTGWMEKDEHKYSSVHEVPKVNDKLFSKLLIEQKKTLKPMGKSSK